MHATIHSLERACKLLQERIDYVTYTRKEKNHDKFIFFLSQDTKIISTFHFFYSEKNREQIKYTEKKDTKRACQERLFRISYVLNHMILWWSKQNRGRSIPSPFSAEKGEGEDEGLERRKKRARLLMTPKSECSSRRPPSPFPLPPRWEEGEGTTPLASPESSHTDQQFLHRKIM